jgi:hypothetical protein
MNKKPREHIRDIVSPASAWDWLLVFGIAGIGWYYMTDTEGGFRVK